MEFFVGLHHPHTAAHFERCLFSYIQVKTRRKPIPCDRWILDSGAFTEVARHGGFRDSPQPYADVINRLGDGGGLAVAVAQDWMCEPFVVVKTGLSVREHQRRTVDRYHDLLSMTDYPVMPVLQGYNAEEYLAHIEDYGDLLQDGAWVGVGSVCKRNGNPNAITTVLRAVHSARPDLRLHGFGVQLRALKTCAVHSLLASADSKAWSVTAWRSGGDENDWRNAAAYADRVGEIRCSTRSNGLAPQPWQAALSWSGCS